MEPVLYIVIALLLAFGPALGFYFGAKCAAHLFGIDLQPGDTLRAARWDEMPEIYRPDPADDDAQEAPLEQAADGEPAEDEEPAAEEPDAATLAAAAMLESACKALDPLGEQVRAAKDAMAEAFLKAAREITAATPALTGDAEPADEGTDTQEEPPAPETPGGTVLREPLAGPWVRQQLGTLAGPAARMADNYAAVLTGAAAAGALTIEERPEPDNIELTLTMTPPAQQGEEA